MGLRIAPGWPPGHFYSPYPDLDEISGRYDALSDPTKTVLPGLDLCIEQQLANLNSFIEMDRPTLAELEFDSDNDAYRAGDAMVLVAQIIAETPKRVVEIGSGHSTALIQQLIRKKDLDIEHLVIDPYPELIFGLLGPEPIQGLELKREPLQAVDPSLVEVLSEGDILFVDSSHVSKAGSDVNALLFEWLPRLPVGVRVHFHDIQFPFESRWDWITQGRVWTESYLLRAFMSFNTQFEITFFTDQLNKQYAGRIEQLGSEFEKSGSSLWIRRVAD